MYVKLHSLSKDDLDKKCLGQPVCQVRAWWRNQHKKSLDREMWFLGQNSVLLHTPFFHGSCAISERRTFLSLPDIITSQPTPTQQPISFFILRRAVSYQESIQFSGIVWNCCLAASHDALRNVDFCVRQNAS